MYSELLMDAGIDPQSDDWSGTPFSDVAVCSSGEIVEDTRNGDFWMLDHSDTDPNLDEWQDSPARLVTASEVYDMRRKHRDDLLADGKYEIASLFGYLTMQ